MAGHFLSDNHFSQARNFDAARLPPQAGVKASFIHALVTAGAESSEDFGDTADEAATPGGLNEHVHRSLHGNGGYGLVADQLDAIFKLSGTDPDPHPARNQTVSMN
ncbi:Serine/threonine protein kinase [Phytophthora cinnamomi]|uniref:Serine/threonine protein kinase n=1 Tax=Phytophthora cinnamomi TaxID=4785 RepID=UPI00355A5F94|nr:Serine/threonine protein kinase [Phytophthora cinnamomi]